MSDASNVPMLLVEYSYFLDIRYCLNCFLPFDKTPRVKKCACAQWPQ